MKKYILDPNVLLGGVIASDDDQEIVQLTLQEGNELPIYDSEAILLIIVLNGGVLISFDKETIEIDSLQILRIEPHEKHVIRALKDNTMVLVVKQLTHNLVFSKKLRFGQCCL